MTNPSHPWYILTTYHRERILRNALQQRGLQCFVPMKFKDNVGDIDDSQAIADCELDLAVHGYVFVQKTRETNEMRRLLNDTGERFGITRRDNGEPYEVPASEMREFRMLCDPHYSHSVFIASQRTEPRVGKPVTIVRGRFRGIRGELHKIDGKHYFIKHLGNLGVMIHISRWFCRVDSE